MTRVIYKEINDCTDCLYNRHKICCELTRPIKSISFKDDCPLPTLETVESFTKYITPDGWKSQEYSGYKPYRESSRRDGQDNWQDYVELNDTETFDLGLGFLLWTLLVFFTGLLLGVQVALE